MSQIEKEEIYMLNCIDDLYHQVKDFINSGTAQYVASQVDNKYTTQEAKELVHHLIEVKRRLAALGAELRESFFDHDDDTSDSDPCVTCDGLYDYT